jgi:hypothetical protein
MQYFSVRACANNGSWSTVRSGLPTVASPGFPNEPPHDDDYVRESDPEVDDSPFSLGAPHQLLVGIALGVGSFHHPPFCSLQGSWFALLGDHAHQATAMEKLSSEVRVVGTIEVDARMLGQLGEAFEEASRVSPKSSEPDDWPERLPPREGFPPRLPSSSV